MRRIRTQSFSKLHRAYETHRLRFFLMTIMAAISFGGILFFTSSTLGSFSQMNVSLSIGVPPPLDPHPPASSGGGGSWDAPLLTYLYEKPPYHTSTPYFMPHDFRFFDLRFRNPRTGLRPAEILIRLFGDDDEELIDETLFNSQDLTGTSTPSGTKAGPSGSSGSGIPQITETRPKFSGKVGIPNAFMFFELHSHGPVFTASIYADENGVWSWQPPRDITAEEHTLYVSVFDRSGQIKFGSAVMQFEVVAPQLVAGDSQPDEPAKAEPRQKKVATFVAPRSQIEIPPSLLDQRKVLFDIRSEIVGTDDPNVVHPGDDLLVQVSIYNVGNPGKLVDAKVSYKLIDAQDTIVFEQEEIIGISTQASFIKIFSTRSSMKLGTYRLEVGVQYGDTEAVSYSTFEARGKPIVKLAGRTTVNVSALIQILALALAISIVVTYTEYKQMESLKRQIRLISEEDLMKAGFIR